MKLKSITFKTFLFTAVLIMLVSTATLGALSLIMPRFYEQSKHNAMQRRLDALAAEMDKIDDITDARQKIAAFCKENNALIWSYVAEDEISTDLSSPFVTIAGDVSFAQAVRIRPQVIDIRVSSEETKSVVGVQSFEAIDTQSFKIALRPQEGSEQLSAFNEAFPTETLAIIVDDYLPNSVTLSGGTAATSDMFFTGARFGSTTAQATGNYGVTSQTSGPLATSLTATYTLQPISEANGVILSLLPYILLMNVAVALVAAYAYSKTITKPILSISGAAEQMRGMEPNAESPICSDDELGALSGNLNSLYSTLCTHIESLQDEAARVTALEQSKTHFLRAAGHELKTPITALNGIVEGMIDDIGVYKDKDRYLKESKNLLRNLALTVNEILDATRHDEANPNDEPLCTLPLADMVTAAFEIQSFQMQKKELRADFSGMHTDCFVTTKEKAMRTALSNVVSNAVKYANENSSITARTEHTNDGLHLVIENDCLPIPAEHLSHLFEPFYSVNYSRDKQKSGTGLGLYIVKKNLDALGLAYSLTNTDTGVAFTVVFDTE